MTFLQTVNNCHRQVENTYLPLISFNDLLNQSTIVIDKLKTPTTDKSQRSVKSILIFHIEEPLRDVFFFFFFIYLKHILQKKTIVPIMEKSDFNILFLFYRREKNFP